MCVRKRSSERMRNRDDRERERERDANCEGVREWVREARISICTCVYACVSVYVWVCERESTMENKKEG